MSTTFNTLKKSARALANAAARRNGTPVNSRSFYSPFAVLGSSNNIPPNTIGNSSAYEKHVEHTSSPEMSHSGTRTYVVSEPDPANTPYEVPSGAFPTSAPYKSYTATEAPQNAGKHSSASVELPHPINSNTSELASRNPPPQGKEATAASKAGIDEAWRSRK